MSAVMERGIYVMMRMYGWSETEGAMLKRDRFGNVTAHRGDAVWEADLNEAIRVEAVRLEVAKVFAPWLRRRR
jgi:hypothetical protein